MRQIGLLAVGLLIGICMTSCDRSPTGPTERDDLLRRLLVFPEFTLPLETVQNSGNPGFLETREKCTDVLNVPAHTFHSFVRSVLEADLAPIRSDDGYRWVLERPGWSPLILHVVPGDTLQYAIFFNYPYGIRWHSNGQIIPGISTGYFYYVFNQSCSWKHTDAGIELSAHFGDDMHIGSNYTLVDSLSGGGSLKWDPGWPEIRFDAVWDGQGHGTWHRANGESGEW